MIATNQNLLSKIGKMTKAGLISALLLICFMVVSVNDAQAQSYVQGREAVIRVKSRLSSISANNCVYPAPNGTPQQVVSKANELRCEYIKDVYGALTTTISSSPTAATVAVAAASGTLQAINEAYNRLVARYPGSPSLEAAVLLRDEMTNLLKS